jgi:hypothetical protein
MLGGMRSLTVFIDLRIHTFKELGLEVDIEDVTTETFDGVVERQDVYLLAVLYVITLMDVDKIAKFHTQVIPATLFT